MNITAQEECVLFSGPGAVRALMRSHNWSMSPLGEPNAWPAALMTMTNVMLATRFPMFLVWGKELVLLYNDAYAEILDTKHPVALGGRFRDVFSDIWHVIGPLTERALGGESVYSENLPITMLRHGNAEQAWLTFSYSPIADAAGRNAGMLCVCTETTDRVLSEQRRALRRRLEDHLRKLKTPDRIGEVVADLLGRHLPIAEINYVGIDASAPIVTLGNWRRKPVGTQAKQRRGHAIVTDLALLAELRLGDAVLVNGIDQISFPAQGVQQKHDGLMVPLFKNGMLAAAMQVRLAEPRHWRRHDKAIVQEAAQRSWDAIERIKAEAERRENEAYFRNMADLAPVMMWVTDGSGLCTYLNSRWLEYTGQSLAEALGLGWLDAVHPDDRPMAKQEFMSANAMRKPYRVEFRLRRADGVYRWIFDVAEPRHAADKGFLGYIGAALDIDERKNAEEALVASNDRFRAAIDAVEGVIWTNNAEGRMTGEQRGWAALTGQKQEEYEGFGWAGAVHPEDVKPTIEAWKNAVKARRPFYFEHRLRRKDGAWRRFSVRAIPAKSASSDVREWVGVHTDVTERRESEDRIKHMATHDALTGLPNRHLLDDRLRHAVEHAHRHGNQLGVLFLDLNRFKVVNDSLGHDNGDRLLVIVAKRLQEAVREGDSVARMGGDEFVVVLEAIDDIDEITAIAEHVLAVVLEPIQLGDHQVTVSTSIGCAIYPKDGVTPSVLLKNADTAMYHAKDLGAGTVRFFSEEMNQKMLERLLTENSLRQALQRNEFIVHYQPKVSIATRKIVGLEALVRWDHPERGLIPPIDFVPLAEEIGLIDAIGRIVLDTACRQNRAWQDEGLFVKMAVNVSPKQLSSYDLAGVVDDALRDAGLDARWLELEITESGLMHDVDAATATLLAIRRSGVSISVDDFGTGYSSLSKLKELPIDSIKIDKSFITGVPAELDDASIVIATISMASSMGLKVVAEGVTNEEQVAFLSERGCQEMQGYLVGRPIDAAAMRELLVKDLDALSMK